MADHDVRYLLVSAALGDDLVARIEAMLSTAGQPWRLWRAGPDTPLDALPLANIEAMYLSVDVLGDSSKTRLTPLMSLFCTVAEQAPRLRWMQVSSAGVDRLPFQVAMRRGVQLTHAGGIASRTVAHGAMAGLLSLARELPRFARQQAVAEWRPARGADAPRDLPGQRALVVGLGAIGCEVARLCQAFGLEVTGLNQSGRPPAGLDATVHPIGQLDEHLARADWLVLCCPLTPQTRHLIDARRLALMPPGAGLVDVSRGGVAQSDAVLAALEQGRLRGAYLDVFESEPLPAASPYWRLPNVLVTPHTAGDSLGRASRLDALFLDNLQRHLDARPLDNLARPD